MEKTIFLRFMYAMTILSSGLTVFEIMQLSTRRVKRQLAKYKLKKQLKKEEQQEDFRYWNFFGQLCGPYESKFSVNCPVQVPIMKKCKISENFICSLNRASKINFMFDKWFRRILNFSDHYWHTDVIHQKIKSVLIYIIEQIKR